MNVTQDFSIMDYMLSISGTLILLLLGGIAYFLRQFATSVKDLKSTVEELRLMFSVEQERIKNTNKVIDSLEERIDCISTKVDIIDKDVFVLKALQQNK